MSDDVAAFIGEMNNLQRKHGLAITWTPSGLAVYDPSGVPPDGGQGNPIGQLITKSFEDGSFRTVVADDE